MLCEFVAVSFGANLLCSPYHFHPS